MTPSGESDNLELDVGQIGLHICEECGASIIFVRGEERPSRPEQVHARWHRDLKQAIAEAPFLVQ